MSSVLGSGVGGSAAPTRSRAAAQRNGTDNLAAHKVDGIAQAITDRGAELRYLPPYSPDLNPIEQAFAKLKALLRKAAERTVDGLWNAIGQLLDLFPPAECANYLSNSGYPRSA